MSQQQGLPDEKIKKLSDDCAKDINRVVQDHYDRARKHEVSHTDASEIVHQGYRKAGRDTKFEDLDKNCTDKPRK